MPATFGIVDLFAGPGGLGEGFASLDLVGHAPFKVGISVEKEASAHRTLTLRAFLRAHQARHGALPQAFIDFHAGLIAEPDWREVDAAAWQHATAEAQCLALGTEPAAAAIDRAIGALRRNFDDTILIGGRTSPSASRQQSSVRRSAGAIAEGASGLGRRMGPGSNIMIHRCRISPMTATSERVTPGPAGKGEPLRCCNTLVG